MFFKKQRRLGSSNYCILKLWSISLHLECFSKKKNSTKSHALPCTVLFYFASMQKIEKTIHKKNKLIKNRLVGTFHFPGMPLSASCCI